MAITYKYEGVDCDACQDDGTRIPLNDKTSQKDLKKLYGQDKLNITKVDSEKAADKSDK